VISTLLRVSLLLLASSLSLRAFAGDVASIPIGPNGLGACPGAAITPGQVVTGQFPAALMGAYVMLPRAAHENRPRPCVVIHTT
jgi:hypothetical protein